MAKNNANPGCGNRYEQIDAIEDRERKKSQNGHFISFKCEICGNARGKGRDHSKCSKILQSRARALLNNG